MLYQAELLPDRSRTGAFGRPVWRRAADIAGRVRRIKTGMGTDAENLALKRRSGTTLKHHTPSRFAIPSKRRPTSADAGRRQAGKTECFAQDAEAEPLS